MSLLVAESPLCELITMAGNEKAWCWSAQDFSDGEASVDKLAARFQTVEAAQQFKKDFEAAKKAYKTIVDTWPSDGWSKLANSRMIAISAAEAK